MKIPHLHRLIIFSIMSLTIFTPECRAQVTISKELWEQNVHQASGQLNLLNGWLTSLQKMQLSNSDAAVAKEMTKTLVVEIKNTLKSLNDELQNLATDVRDERWDQINTEVQHFLQQFAQLNESANAAQTVTLLAQHHEKLARMHKKADDILASMPGVSGVIPTKVTMWDKVKVPLLWTSVGAASVAVLWSIVAATRTVRNRRRFKDLSRDSADLDKPDHGFYDNPLYEDRHHYNDSSITPPTSAVKTTVLDTADSSESDESDSEAGEKKAEQGSRRERSSTHIGPPPPMPTSKK